MHCTYIHCIYIHCIYIHCIYIHCTCIVHAYIVYAWYIYGPPNRFCWLPVQLAEHLVFKKRLLLNKKALIFSELVTYSDCVHILYYTCCVYTSLRNL